MWKKILSMSLSVRQVEQMAKKLTQPVDKIEVQETTRLSAYLQDAEDKLRKALTTKVKLKPKKTGGSIEIMYYDNDDLDRLVNALLGEQ